MRGRERMARLLEEDREGEEGEGAGGQAVGWKPETKELPHPKYLKFQARARIHHLIPRCFLYLLTTCHLLVTKKCLCQMSFAFRRDYKKLNIYPICLIIVINPFV